MTETSPLRTSKCGPSGEAILDSAGPVAAAGTVSSLQKPAVAIAGTRACGAAQNALISEERASHSRGEHILAVTARQQASRPIEIGRRQLIDRILTRPEPIVVLEGPAGTGKSALLAQLGTRIGRQPRLGPAPPPCEGGVVLLWDTASSLSPETLPEEFVAGRSRLVLAKRPETEVPGLARAIVYGKAFVLGAAELLFTAEELAEAFSPARAGRILERSGGWPLLLPFAIGRQRDDTVLSDMLEHDLLRQMS